MEGGYRANEVWLGGWCEGDLGHQRDDGKKGVESPGAYVDE